MKISKLFVGIAVLMLVAAVRAYASIGTESELPDALDAGPGPGDSDLEFSSETGTDTGTETLTDGQELESERAKVFEIGGTREEFVEKVGVPDFTTPSVGGDYEELWYQTTLPFSSHLTATVEITTGRVVEIGHGEDWDGSRRLAGYEFPAIEWDYDKKSPWDAEKEAADAAAKAKTIAEAAPSDAPLAESEPPVAFTGSAPPPVEPSASETGTTE